MGFEPATACLQNRCSTVELHRRTMSVPAKFDWEKTLRIASRRRETRLAGGSPGTRTPNLLIKSQLLYH